MTGSNNHFEPQHNPRWPLTWLSSHTLKQDRWTSPAQLSLTCAIKNNGVDKLPSTTLHLTSPPPSLYSSRWYDLWFTSSARLRNVAHAFRCVIGVGGDLIKITVAQIPLKLRIYSRQWSSHPRTGEVSFCTTPNDNNANPCFHDITWRFW